MLAWLKENHDAISSLTIVSGVLVFLVGVIQFLMAERWKRTEFLAKLYKDFVDDPDARRAMWMLDWQNRRINFGSDTHPVFVKYDYNMLISALQKHNNATIFTADEVRIRDTFDRFFSYVEQFERAIQNGVVHQRDVYPYFAYWLEMLNVDRHLPANVRACVLTYINTYGFPDVDRFLKRSWPKFIKRTGDEAVP